MIIKDYSYKVQLGVGWDDLTVTHHQSPVVQSNSYYPFGMQHATSWTRSTTLKNNRLYNAGAELNEHTKNYETFYRQYDPAIGRFTSIDPLATKYTSTTPYNYAFNDPIALNDPLGDDALPDWLYNMVAMDMYNSVGDEGSWSWTNTGGGTFTSNDGGRSYSASSYGYSSNHSSFPRYYGTSIQTVRDKYGHLKKTKRRRIKRNKYGLATNNSFLNEDPFSEDIWGDDPWGMEDAQNGGRLFENEGDAYRFMWNSSFDADGNVSNEVAGFLTTEGVLVLPTEGRRTNGEYARNSPRTSYNDFLPVSRKGGNLYVTFEGNRIQVLGQVHTHPNSQPFGKYEVTPDLGVQNFLGVPINIMRSNGFYNLNNTFLGTRQEFYNGTKSLFGK